MACPGCGAAGAEVFFRSPPLPVLSNEVVRTRAAALAAPRGEIALARCPACDLVHNAAFDPAAVRYTGEYENALHFSPRFRAYAEELAQGLVARHGVRRGLVVELGCGDGAFLALVCRLGDNRGVGFDPAHDGARALPLPAGVTIHARPVAASDAGLQPDLICCRHVLEHVAEPRTLLATVQRLAGARPEAVVFFEVPNARHTLERLAIWDVVYEHCLYFSATALAGLFRRSGFVPLAVRETYGGQFLTIEARPATPAGASAGGAADRGPSAPADRAPGAPVDPGSATGGVASEPGGLEPLTRAFARAHADTLARWRDVLGRVDREGTPAVVWGAGSKAVTFLNLLGATDRTIRCVVDVNPRKQGAYVVGTGQAIVAPDRLREVRPGLVLVMNPLYRDEVEAELARLRVAARVLVA